MTHLAPRHHRGRVLHPLCLAAAVAAALSACGGTEEVRAELPPAEGGRLFTLLPSEATGVRFANRVAESRELNVFTYRNFYNGGGVAIGDLTGDGLPEIVLTSNQEGPSVYANQGAFRFRDITSDAGLSKLDRPWTTGVTLADVNGDGRLDIYLSHAGPGEPATRANTLWIHQGVDDDGVPRFREMAAEYGVADHGYTIQAAFLDHDRDGDLDLFLINNSPRPVSSFGLRNTRGVRHQYGGHKLYRNDGGRFTDVSEQAGIHGSEIGFGLGLGVGDVNRDGWPDIYVANDFFERDYLFVNRGDGSFSEAFDTQTSAITYFSMGLDIADVDNDGWSDIYTTDMLPENDRRLKLTGMFEGWDVYQAKVRNGYHHQFMRNMLQRNNRDGTFSDVGWMAGVARTDWSWSALMADLDLDGLKDIFVTNGIAKDITSQDYVAFLANDETMKNVTAGGKERVDFEKLSEALTSTPLPNHVFHNAGGLRFEERGAEWGLDTPSLSNGAAYGDLDGDGALDLVVNNVNQEAFVYRNNARTLRPEHRVLRVRLEGEGANSFGVGARVTVHGGEVAQVQEQFPTRGFQSSMDPVLVFGLGARGGADSVRVEWPDGRSSLVRTPRADTLLVVRQAEAEKGAIAPAAPPVAAPAPRAAPFAEVGEAAGIAFAHDENDFVDFDRERLIPKMLSREGPAMAVADVNGDGLDDLFIGGAKEQAGAILVQRANGRFEATNAALLERDAISEDVGAVFFDANGDGSPDLYVVSGGNEYSAGAPALQDRLYLNDGRGTFRKAPAEHLPAETTSGSRVAAADYDGDGDQDLFVGGRSVPWQYGTSPRSVLLRNDGRGRFTDATDALAPGLATVGMVTDALWHDVDDDGRRDLLVVGEWMPITVYRNAGGGRLAQLDVPGLQKSHGWWNRIVAGDFDGDGRTDFVVGNLGLNSRMHASEREPATMLVKDFDGNGFVEQVLATYEEGKSYPLALRDDLIKSIPPLKARFLKYGDYAGKTMDDVFPEKDRAGAVERTAYTFASVLVRNEGKGAMTVVPLPAEAQIAPVYAILPEDVDGDGALDLLLAGNLDGVKTDIGRLSATEGLVLRGDGKGGFSALRPAESGFRVPGQSRDVRRVRTRNGPVFIVGRNDARPLVFRIVQGN